MAAPRLPHFADHALSLYRASASAAGAAAASAPSTETRPLQSVLLVASPLDGRACEAAEAIREALDATGALRCRRARRLDAEGAGLDRSAERASHAVLVLVLTERTLRSAACCAEVVAALDRLVPVLPVVVDGGNGAYFAALGGRGDGSGMDAELARGLREAGLDPDAVARRLSRTLPNLAFFRCDADAPGDDVRRSQLKAVTRAVRDAAKLQPPDPPLDQPLGHR